METRVGTLRFGGDEILVSVVETGEPDERRGVSGPERAADALEQAQGTVEALARSTHATVGRLRAAGNAPDAVDVELGLAFTVAGNILLAGGSVGASVTIRLHYINPDSGSI